MVVVVAINLCANLNALRAVGDNHLALYGVNISAVHSAFRYDADTISCRHIAPLVKREALASGRFHFAQILSDGLWRVE